jgi:DNA mismatch repair protein MutL
MYPPYFLYLTVDPSRIDVNIHPTKTEIKFEDEQAIWQILAAAVRESMGKTGAVPLMDFDAQDAIEIPVFRPGGEVKVPKSALNPHFNPFEADVPPGWEALYKDGYDTFDRTKSEGDTFRRLILDEPADEDTELNEFISGGFEPDTRDDESWAEQGALEIESGLSAGFPYLKLSNRYAVVARDGALTVIDLNRAHHRVLYERFLEKEQGGITVNQQELFAEEVAVAPDDLKILTGVRDELLAIGFDLEATDATHVVLRGIPADIQPLPAAELVDSLLDDLHEHGVPTAENRRKALALTLAGVFCVKQTKNRQPEEIEEIILSLYACREPAFTADGRAVMTVLGTDEIKKRLQ